MDTGPYLRLAFDDQAAAPDAVMPSGRAPSGSVTVASEPVEADHDFPKGFYLRVVDGTAWLRGYMCDNQHVFAPNDRFAFQAGSGQEDQRSRAVLGGIARGGPSARRCQSGALGDDQRLIDEPVVRADSGSEGSPMGRTVRGTG
ncbi:hypothetical protein [Xylanimonas ulmi]|uniref:hypothetical protein n=1 Tax=Xylanimonas ulmi TaxID=228973 RepID=UPI00102C8ECD|nr:hypothetical protein [Xylanibacterium ulmi]